MINILKMKEKVLDEEEPIYEEMDYDQLLGKFLLYGSILMAYFPSKGSEVKDAMTALGMLKAYKSKPQSV